MVLEVVNVVSAMAADEGAGSVVASSGLARALEEVWRDKRTTLRWYCNYS